MLFCLENWLYSFFFLKNFTINTQVIKNVGYFSEIENHFLKDNKNQVKTDPKKFCLLIV